MRYSYRSASPVWVLMAVNLLVFLATSAFPQLTIQMGLIPAFLSTHPWTLLTAMFVHAGFFHFLFNMIALYFFGTFLLMLVDSKWFLILYFVGGIVGNLFYAWLAAPMSIAVGASGAIYALGGALVVMRPNLRVYVYFLLPMPLWIAVIIGFLLTLPGGNIAWQAHLGGLIVGLIFGFFFRRRERQRVRPGYYRWR